MKQPELDINVTGKERLNKENIRLEQQIDTHKNEMQERKKAYDTLWMELEEL